MLDNVLPVDELRGLARRRKKSVVTKTVRPNHVEAEVADGWQVKKKNKASVRLEKAKSKAEQLEDRVWLLMYRLGFASMSGERGAQLAVNEEGGGKATSQIDVVALDGEIALAIECKSSQLPGRRPRFQEELAKHSIMRPRFVSAVKAQFPTESKRRIELLFFTWDVVLSENDVERAEKERVHLFDEHDLNYYERLVSHLGAAARYQFLADVVPGTPVPGLEITVPAIRTKMGGTFCYFFPIAPAYLLKIAYVAHRMKGKATDVDAYQRMIAKSRLSKIRQFITDDGIFPTNIVVNFEKSQIVQFERATQEPEAEGALLGWLRLKPTYKAAWIIDGQHRLFAFSGHARAESAKLCVLAFVGLPRGEQAQLFIDINNEQKSVKRRLLLELVGDLKWDSPDEEDRVEAVLSRVVQALNEELDSPLKDRILLTDDARSFERCISLDAIFKTLDAPDLFVRRRAGHIEYGAFWRVDPMESLKRTLSVTKSWLTSVRDAAIDWWQAGSGPDGGLAMNDGVTICLSAMRSVIQHLERRGLKPGSLSTKELVAELEPFAAAVGDYFQKFSPEQRATFRRTTRGVQGQTRGRRQCEVALREKFPKYDPVGLDDWLRLEAAGTNTEGREIILRLEAEMNRICLERLKEEFKGDEDMWWYEGIPDTIRKKVVERVESEKGKQGGREQNFDLVDYRVIAVKNWNLFQDVFDRSGKGSKEDRTKWIADMNQIRKKAMHLKGENITFEELDLLRDLESWLKEKVIGKQDDE